MSTNESERCEVEWCDRARGHASLHSRATHDTVMVRDNLHSGPILVHPMENAPFDLKAFAREQIPAEFSISYIAEIPPDVDNPLDDQELLSELFSHPRKEGWGLFVSYAREIETED